jgi:hypothetical protein
MKKMTSSEEYLGQASIVGNGSSSKLEAIAEHDLLIRIDSPSSNVDFYIEYNMSCNGDADEGVITLILSLNGENITPAIVQTPTSKEGILKMEDVVVNRGDALGFVIEVVYVSVLPPYSNETKAVGAGVISKSVTFEKEPSSFVFFRCFRRLLEKFPLLEKLFSPV